MMTKKQIKETKKIFLSEFEGKIDDMISQLQEWKNEGWEGLDSDCRYDLTFYELYKHRLETDQEYRMRMYQEELYKENRRKQYEELKKEFGNDQKRPD